MSRNTIHFIEEPHTTTYGDNKTKMCANMILNDIMKNITNHHLSAQTLIITNNGISEEQQQIKVSDLFSGLSGPVNQSHAPAQTHSIQPHGEQHGLMPGAKKMKLSDIYRRFAV